MGDVNGWRKTRVMILRSGRQDYVPGLRYESVHGLVLARVAEGRQGWSVTHIESGAFVKEKLSLSKAKQYLLQIAPYCDWSKDAEEVRAFFKAPGTPRLP